MTHRIISQWQQFCAATKRFNFHALETSPVHFSSWQGPIFCGTACSANCKNHNFYLWLGNSFLFLCDSASAGSLRTGTRVLSSSKNLSKYLLDVFPFFSLQIGRRSTEGIQDICLHFHSRSIKTHLFTSFWGHPALKSQIFSFQGLFFLPNEFVTRKKV